MQAMRQYTGTNTRKKKEAILLGLLSNALVA